MRIVIIVFVSVICFPAFSYHYEVPGSQEVYYSDSSKIDNHNLRLGINFGISHWVNTVNDTNLKALKDYINSFHNGMNFSAHFEAFFPNNYGFSFIYSQYTSKSKLNDSLIINYKEVNNLEDNILLNFIGAGIAYRRLSLHEKLMTSMNANLGIVGYHDNGAYGDDTARIKAQSLGVNLNVAFDYYFSRYFGISSNAGVTYSKVRHLQVNNEAGSINPEPLCWIYMSVGLCLRD